jgi:hypothetical protein
MCLLPRATLRSDSEHLVMSHMYLGRYNIPAPSHPYDFFAFQNMGAAAGGWRRDRLPLRRTWAMEEAVALKVQT